MAVDSVVHWVATSSAAKSFIMWDKHVIVC